jgi:hypothetical protein
MNIINSHIIAVIDEIIESTRWQDSDTPKPNGIKELCTRVTGPTAYKSYIETEEYKLLIEVIESYEASLNDDWMPYEIEGLNLEKAFIFITKIKQIVISESPQNYQSMIIDLYHQIKKNA